MKVASNFSALCGLALVLGGFPVAANAQDVATIVTRMRDAVMAGKDMRADFTMEMSNEAGEIARWSGRYFRRAGADGGIRMVFDSPPDLRGTEIAARVDADGEEHLRIFLPSLRRTRDLRGDAQGESFLGTDFNYEDLGLAQLATSENSLGKDDEVGGRQCATVVSKPTKGWWYGKVVRCVDKKSYLPLRTEYFDRNGIAWKVQTLDGVETIGGNPTATRITMRTIPTGTATVLTLTNVAYGTGVPASLFARP
jgi:outer membrane lipoprotein-sorting protein